MHLQPLDHAKLGKAGLKWMDGWNLLGDQDDMTTSGEKTVGDSNGVFKVSSIRRNIERSLEMGSYLDRSHRPISLETLPWIRR